MRSPVRRKSAESPAADASTETVVEPTPIRLCQGYARDHRPDLKNGSLNSDTLRENLCQKLNKG